MVEFHFEFDSKKSGARDEIRDKAWIGATSDDMFHNFNSLPSHITKSKLWKRYQNFRLENVRINLELIGRLSKIDAVTKLGLDFGSDRNIFSTSCQFCRFYQW